MWSFCQVFLHCSIMAEKLEQISIDGGLGTNNWSLLCTFQNHYFESLAGSVYEIMPWDNDIFDSA